VRLLEAQEVAHAIAALLRKLPEHLRTVFVLREADERDYESIATALGVPVGTVRSRLHRAREALKDGLRALACA
jgi:RNA polymerase sigma-70 factor (ECF subfamily)